MKLTKEISQERYIDFIKRWSDIYNSGFLIFVAVLATVFINIFTNNSEISILQAFQAQFVLIFILFAIAALFISLIVSCILYILIVFGFGSLVYLVNRVNYYLFKKWGLSSVLGLSWIILGIGIFLMYYFGTLSVGGVIGLICILIGIAPSYLSIRNKVEKDNAVPAYIN